VGVGCARGRRPRSVAPDKRQGRRLQGRRLQGRRLQGRRRQRGATRGGRRRGWGGRGGFTGVAARPKGSRHAHAQGSGVCAWEGAGRPGWGRGQHRQRGARGARDSASRRAGPRQCSPRAKRTSAPSPGISVLWQVTGVEVVLGAAGLSFTHPRPNAPPGSVPLRPCHGPPSTRRAEAGGRGEGGYQHAKSRGRTVARGEVALQGGAVRAVAL
jgi:hypothetical protein